MSKLRQTSPKRPWENLDVRMSTGRSMLCRTRSKKKTLQRVPTVRLKGCSLPTEGHTVCASPLRLHPACRRQSHRAPLDATPPGGQCAEARASRTAAKRNLEEPSRGRVQAGATNGERKRNFARCDPRSVPQLPRHPSSCFVWLPNCTLKFLIAILLHFPGAWAVRWIVQRLQVVAPALVHTVAGSLRSLRRRRTIILTTRAPGSALRPTVVLTPNL
jgi:hypothetical protein